MVTSSHPIHSISAQNQISFFVCCSEVMPRRNSVRMPTARRKVCATTFWMHTDIFIILVLCLHIVHT